MINRFDSCWLLVLRGSAKKTTVQIDRGPKRFIRAIDRYNHQLTTINHSSHVR